MKKSFFIPIAILLSATVILLFVFLQISHAIKDKEMKLVYDTFSMAGTDSQIVLNSDNTLTIRNYDMSELEKESYEDFVIAQKNAGREEGNKLTKEEEQRIRDDIDLNHQFLDRENSFSFASEDGFIGIYVPVENCDLFFYLQFYPSDKTIVFDNNTFTLEKR
jgi:hypothetical protein